MRRKKNDENLLENERVNFQMPHDIIQSHIAKEKKQYSVSISLLEAYNEMLKILIQ